MLSPRMVWQDVQWRIKYRKMTLESRAAWSQAPVAQADLGDLFEWLKERLWVGCDFEFFAQNQ